MIWSNWKTKCMSHLDLEYVFVCASFATWAKSRQVSLKKSKFSVRFWNPKGIMVKSPNVVQVPIIYLYPIGAPYYIIDKLWVGFELMASLSAHLTLKQSWSLRRDSLRFLKHKDLYNEAKNVQKIALIIFSTFYTIRRILRSLSFGFFSHCENQLFSPHLDHCAQ